MAHVEIPKMERKGTVRLLQMLDGLPKGRHDELLTHITNLELRADYLVINIE